MTMPDTSPTIAKEEEGAQPYYQHGGITLYHGDCLDVLPGLALDAQVDLILCDLPYGTTACEWDSVIPLGPLWAEYRRVLKPTGAVVLTASQPFTSVLVMSNLDWLKYCLVWEKSVPTGFLDANNKPLKAHEDILIFSPGTTANGSGRKMTYNPLRQAAAPYRHRRGAPAKQYNERPQHGWTTDNGGQSYPRSVVYFPKELGTVHPTQKPLALFAYLIATYSNPGELVLDNCAGSGTTLRAAKDLNRRAVGIEREERYCEMAVQRLSQEVLPLEAAV